MMFCYRGYEALAPCCWLTVSLLFSVWVEEGLGTGEGGGGGDLHPWIRCKNTTGELACGCHGEMCTEIPANLKGTTILSITDSGIVNISNTSLQLYKKTLKKFEIRQASQLQNIENGTFDGMVELREIIINHAPHLESLPANLLAISLTKLKHLKISNSGLLKVPDLSKLTTAEIMDTIDLSGNRIKRLAKGAVHVKVAHLILQNNDIEEIEEKAFFGSEIGKLSLSGNVRLKRFHDNALFKLKSLLVLDLSATSLETLPKVGLDQLEEFRMEDTTSLKVFPSIYTFKQITKAWLTYPYHCCAFHFPSRHDPAVYAAHVAELERMCASLSTPTQEVLNSAQNSVQYPRWARSVNDDRKPHFGAFANNFSPGGGFGPIPTPTNGTVPLVSTTNDNGVFHPSTVIIPTNSTLFHTCGTLAKNYDQVRCLPAPDAFNPCEDIMGNGALRVTVWFVVVAAMIGNLAVMVVLLSSQMKSVSKFLMCNLAFADFCMGFYLAIIAAMDLHTMGEYFNHAIDWQEGLGCQIAGFLTVFASELSIFTLTVITVERWFAITFAIHLHKRLELNTASKVMVCGWVYAIVLAALPLVGISDYSKTSICLPMETRRTTDQIYLAVILVVNGLAFVLICVCYIKMYWSIRNHNCADRSSDVNVAKRVAKRMAMLVFTDFACWAPIAFFGLTALSGYPLISVTHAKFLLVFFYPLNSCANPFLYAILTKHYRRDLFVLLGRLGLCRQRAAKYKTFSTNQRTTVSTGTAVNRRKNSADHTPPTSVRSDADLGLTDGIVARRLSPVREHSPVSEGEEWEHSSTHKGSPHPVRNSSTKQTPSPEQEELLQRALNYDKRLFPNHTPSELIPLAANGTSPIDRSSQNNTSV